MTTYQITSAQGQDMGQYEAASPAAALDAMARDAGYRDATDAAEQVGTFEGTIEEREEDRALQDAADYAR